MQRVLVTDGLQRKTLSVVRAIGKKGIQTVVGEKISFSPAACSNFCYKSFVYPDPHVTPEKFYHKLQEQLSETGCNILFPMDDLTTSLIMDNRIELEKKCLIPLPNQQSYQIAADKYETIVWAKRAMVHCPITYMPKTIEELVKLSTEMDFPVVIKPRKSSGSRGIRIVENQEELIVHYYEIHKFYPFPMIQEYIPQGDRYDVCLLYDQHHKLKCSFIQKELRHFPIEMGPSTVQESVVYPELLEISRKLMTDLNWTGIVEIEFMIDKRNGFPILMEINPRFWNSLELSIDCGVNFPYYLLKVAGNEPFDDIHHYEVGRKMRWFIPGDLLHFLTNHQRLQMDPPFISFTKNQIKDDTFLLKDPLPMIATIVACIRYGLNKKTRNMMLKR